MIALHNICKTYGSGDGALRVLTDVCVSVRAGEYTALLGKSGSGKSTLLNILGFLDTPTSGSYAFAGENVAALSERKRAFLRNQKIGFVFQSFHLLPRFTTLENVILPLQYSGTASREAKDRAMAALDRVGMSERMKHRPNELSGGQRQRVAIARALVTKPQLLIADEPTGNLDTETAAGIMQLFKDIHRDGSTILMVTHDAGVAAHCLRQIELRDGRILSDSDLSAAQNEISLA